jgi:hypothetical protein
MFVFMKYDRQNHVWSFMMKYLGFLCKFTSWSGETPTGNFSDVFLSWTRIMSILIGWPISNTLTPHGKKMHVIEIYVKSEIFRHKTSHMVLSIIFHEDKHNISLHLSIFYEYRQFFQHRICFSIQPQLQLVNLHRNGWYFVITLHTWFCLSYFMKTNIKFYCIYQYFISITQYGCVQFLIKQHY